MKRIAFIALIAAAILLPVFALSQMYRLRPKTKTLAEELAELPRKINPTLPQAIDDATELTEVETTSDSITYKYRITTAEAQEIDTLQLMNALETTVKDKACAEPELTDRFLSKGVTLHYVYHDANMQQFGSVEVKPADCGY